MFASLLAHQGGWDEVLLIAGPIVAIAGLLMLAKRRVDEAVADASTDTAAETVAEVASAND